MPILQNVLSTVGWTFLAVVLVFGGVKLFDLLDPIDYQAEIRRGNIAAGIMMATLVLSIAAIIIAVILTP